MSFALISRIIIKRVGLDTPRVYDAPLGPDAGSLRRLRLDGTIDITGAAGSLITADAAGSLMKSPENQQARVVGHGKIVDGVFEIHRFYFIGSAEGAPENVLQVITQNGRVLDGEVKLFQKLAEFNPQSKQEWDMWLKGLDGVPPLLTGPTIKWQETTEFKRHWASTDTKHWREALDTGDAKTGVSLNTMLFSRQLVENVNEWLQLSLCHEGNERWIDAYVGITIDPAEINAI